MRTTAAPVNNGNKREKCSAPYQLFFEIDSNLGTNLQAIHLIDPKTQTSYVGDKIRVAIQDIDVFRKTQRFLLENRIPTRTLDTTAPKPIKYVLRGLPASTSADEISAALQAHQIEVLHMSVLRNRKTRAEMPLFLLTLKSSPAAQNIRQIKTINYLTVTFEDYKFRNVAQCYRCQRYGHSSFVCALTPRCVRCAGPHGKDGCSTTPDQFRCANCNGSHAANYKGCPEHPMNKSKKNPNSRNSAQNNAPKSRQTFIPAPPPAVNAWTKNSNQDFPPLPPRSDQVTPLATQPTPQPSTSTHSAPKAPRSKTSNPQPQPTTQKPKQTANNLKILKETPPQNDFDDNSTGFAGIGEIFKIVTEFMKTYNIKDILNLFREIAEVMNSKIDTMSKLLTVCEKLSTYFTSPAETASQAKHG